MGFFGRRRKKGVEGTAGGTASEATAPGGTTSGGPGRRGGGAAREAAPMTDEERERLTRLTQEAYERGIAHQVLPSRARTALDAFDRSAGHLDELFRAAPDDPELWHMRGALLYSRASTLLALGRAEEAVADLGACVDAYGRSGLPSAPLLAADALIRRARAHGEAERPMAALADVDRAIGAYVTAGAYESPHPLLPDFARVLALAAAVQLKVGDVDQALACARQSLARYKDLTRQQGGLGRIEAGYMVDAAGDTASRLEAVRGNWDAALGVDLVVREAAEAGLGPLGPALAREGLHLRLAGRVREAGPVLARAEEIAPGAVAREEETAALPLPPSLADALTAAEALLRERKDAPVPVGELAPLRQELTGHESYSASVRVRMGSAFAPKAAVLVRTAELLLEEGQVAQAWRIALETHLICGSIVHRAGDAAPDLLPGLAGPWGDALEVAREAAVTAGKGSFVKDVDAAAAQLRAMLTAAPDDGS
ncbi:hypothetical protein [Streptomyces omiyaensis]|uniref:hypothetical protein n=1 Tax=Streptomyces omiyaensis TaxID=68247 RepID=UPI001672AA51|nr:hypothetical protein [Streptomyces omiyaensis]GGY25076.1 hypothetical protein GCM10010363_01540 [Streptomyces omiyaensis]